MAARLQQIAKESVRKKDERGENLIISLDGRKRDSPLKDEDFVALAPHLFSAVKDYCAALSRNNKIAHVEFHGECNVCGDKGAAAICGMLVKLRQRMNWAMRVQGGIFPWGGGSGIDAVFVFFEMVTQLCLHQAKVERARSNVLLLNRKPAIQSSPPSQSIDILLQLSSQKGYGVPARENYNDTNVKVLLQLSRVHWTNSDGLQTFQADEFPALPGAGARAAVSSFNFFFWHPTFLVSALNDSRTKENSRNVKDSAVAEQKPRNNIREQHSERDPHSVMKSTSKEEFPNGTKAQDPSNSTSNHRWPNFEDGRQLELRCVEVNGDSISSQPSILPSPPRPFRSHAQAAPDKRDLSTNSQSNSTSSNPPTLYKQFGSKPNSQASEDPSYSRQLLHVQPTTSTEQQNFLFPINDSISSQTAASNFSELATNDRPYNLLQANLNDFESNNDCSALPAFHPDGKSAISLAKELVPVGKEWLSPSLTGTKFVDLEPLQPEHVKKLEDVQTKGSSVSSLSSQFMDLSWKAQPTSFNELVKPHAFTQGQCANPAL
eukprot:751271-Hanusia_phi.AAC.2